MSNVTTETLFETLKTSVIEHDSNVNNAALDLVAAVAARGDAQLTAHTRARVERLRQEHDDDETNAVLRHVVQKLGQELTMMRLHEANERARRADEGLRTEILALLQNGNQLKNVAAQTGIDPAQVARAYHKPGCSQQ
jgi:hypothetical protein